LNHTTAAETVPYASGTVTSRDGTVISYRQLGTGPGVLLVQGAMGSAQNYMDLAGALAGAFTVYVAERRGRGLSGPPGRNYGLQREVEDLDALLGKTGARNVFGLSSGGIITLQAALTSRDIHKAIIYEPPFYVGDQATPRRILQRCNQEMAQGKVAATLVTGMLGAEMGPALFRALPRRLLEAVISIALKGEAKKGSGDYMPMRDLAPTLQQDFGLVVELGGDVGRFRAVQADVLLMGGSKSPAFLKASLGALEEVLPRATRIEIGGAGHRAPWNYDKQRNPDGKPERVAEELRRFFA
jgi:pimeloyl-ACP methyl ester carboxylesterase